MMKIVSFIVCDDIRNEVGGKHSLMGVYGNSIEFRVSPENKNKWPKSMKVGIFVNIKLEDNDREKDINSFSLNIDYSGKVEKVAKGLFSPAHIPMSHSVNLAIVHNNFVFKEAGEVRFFLDFFDGKDVTIQTIAPDYVLKISEKAILQPKEYGSKPRA